RSQPSLRLQYPVQPWLQLALEMPVVILDRDMESSVTTAGDLLLTAPARAGGASDRPIQLDLVLELTLPTGDPDRLGGSTALRPFAAAGITLGPFDIIGNLSSQWLLRGPPTQPRGVPLHRAPGAPS